MRTLEQDYDLFFIRQDFYDQHLQDFKEELILPKLDYYQHPIYSSIHAISSYQTWKITFDYVIVQQAGWYEDLPQNLQYDLLNEQRRNHNAMMYKDNLVTINFWHRMPKSWQDEMIEGLDDSFSDVRIPDNIPERIVQFHNQIPQIHGPNCYSAVIYCLTNNDQIIFEWMFANTFLNFLKRNQYYPVKDMDYQAGDVVCFYDMQHTLQHACYMVTDSLCFNKNGQTFHDFWAINSFEKIKAEWPQMTLKIFRKIKE